MRGLEARLGLRLLTRTTRSVAPTEAGERLLRTMGPCFDEIDAELAALSELREKPAGTIRITTGEHAAETILWPALARLLPDYPDIKVELVVDNGLTDIVAERYDAGVRLGEQVAKDMIAVRIGPDMRMAVVGATSYFARRPPPQTPQDLSPTPASTCACPPWRAVRVGVREGRARTEGAGRRAARLQQHRPMLEAALAGFGLAYLPEDQVQAHIADGPADPRARGLVPAVSGLSPLLPSRRQTTPAFALLVDALRYRD